MSHARMFLSPPHLSGLEQQYVADAFATNWVTPLGPHVDAFEREFAEVVGADHAVALSSGTAALHLALQLAGVGPGDEVLASTLTFVASVNPIAYLGAKPVFIDSEASSWNMDPVLLEETLEQKARAGRLPKAVVVVHLYGQSANLDPIVAACARHEIPLIEDAAEALGASYKGRAPGTFGAAGIYSFNGNKIITTAGGGMLVTPDGALATHARKLATQARDPAPHYEHSEIGYNYRLSNVLAAIGRGQLKVLEERVAARRRNFALYAEALGDLPGIAFMPEAAWGTHTRWLTTLTIDPQTVLPLQTSHDVAYVTPEARMDLTLLKTIHIRPRLLYTRVLSDIDSVLRIPKLFFNGQLAFEDHLFKGKLEVQIGVDVHWQSAYKPMGYDVVNQTFYNQDQVTTPAYLVADVFFTGKMKRGRFFFKYYNAGQLFTRMGYMPTPYYRSAPNLLDFGVDMLLFD
jgi:pyridoxal phosphate-dependent aminotransferase EpsN